MKVYRLNDCDWYMAPTLEEAIQAAMDDSGLPRDEVCDDPSEVNEADMHRLRFVDDDGVTKRTFAEELARRVAGGEKTQAFASTEY